MRASTSRTALPSRRRPTAPGLTRTTTSATTTRTCAIPPFDPLPSLPPLHPPLLPASSPLSAHSPQNIGPAEDEYKAASQALVDAVKVLDAKITDLYGQWFKRLAKAEAEYLVAAAGAISNAANTIQSSANTSLPSPFLSLSAAQPRIFSSLPSPSQRDFLRWPLHFHARPSFPPPRGLPCFPSWRPRLSPQRKPRSYSLFSSLSLLPAAERDPLCFHFCF